MAKLIAQAPVLLVRDFQASVDYWQECLGFTPQIWGDPPDFAIMNRDECYIMLSKADKEHSNQPNWRVVDKMWNAYFWVDDAKAIYDEFIASGAKIDYKLHEKPYGVLEFGISDPDEHDIAFGQVISDIPKEYK